MLLENDTINQKKRQHADNIENVIDRCETEKPVKISKHDNNILLNVMTTNTEDISIFSYVNSSPTPSTSKDSQVMLQNKQNLEKTIAGHASNETTSENEIFETDIYPVNIKEEVEVKSVPSNMPHTIIDHIDLTSIDCLIAENEIIMETCLHINKSKNFQEPKSHYKPIKQELSSQHWKPSIQFHGTSNQQQVSLNQQQKLSNQHQELISQHGEAVTQLQEMSVQRQEPLNQNQNLSNQHQELTSKHGKPISQLQERSNQQQEPLDQYLKLSNQHQELTTQQRLPSIQLQETSNQHQELTIQHCKPSIQLQGTSNQHQELTTQHRKPVTQLQGKSNQQESLIQQQKLFNQHQELISQHGEPVTQLQEMSVQRQEPLNQQQKLSNQHQELISQHGEPVTQLQEMSVQRQEPLNQNQNLSNQHQELTSKHGKPISQLQERSNQQQEPLDQYLKLSNQHQELTTQQRIPSIQLQETSNQHQELTIQHCKPSIQLQGTSNQQQELTYQQRKPSTHLQRISHHQQASLKQQQKLSNQHQELTIRHGKPLSQLQKMLNQRQEPLNQYQKLSIPQYEFTCELRDLSIQLQRPSHQHQELTNQHQKPTLEFLEPAKQHHPSSTIKMHQTIGRPLPETSRSNHYHYTSFNNSVPTVSQEASRLQQQKSEVHQNLLKFRNELSNIQQLSPNMTQGCSQELLRTHKESLSPHVQMSAVTHSETSRNNQDPAIAHNSLPHRPNFQPRNGNSHRPSNSFQSTSPIIDLQPSSAKSPINNLHSTISVINNYLLSILQGELLKGNKINISQNPQFSDLNDQSSDLPNRVINIESIFKVEIHQNDKTHDPTISQGKGESTSVNTKNIMNSKNCPICMDYLKAKDVASTFCGHIFCMPCIQAALRSTSKKCPTCRKKLSGLGFHRIFLDDLLL